jgi:hypothetical protein
MAKYKVCYSGFAFVEADSEDEAKKEYCDGLTIYEDKSIDLVMEVDEFRWRI